MNPIEETGKTARSFFEVMRNEPMALGLIVSNWALLGLFAFILIKSSATREHEMNLLARCVVPGA